MATEALEPPRAESRVPAPARKECAFCLGPILPGEEVFLEGKPLHAGGHFIAFRGRMEKVRIGGGL